jgi:hypothetical protein
VYELRFVLRDMRICPESVSSRLVLQQPIHDRNLHQSVLLPCRVGGSRDMSRWLVLQRSIYHCNMQLSFLLSGTIDVTGNLPGRLLLHHIHSYCMFGRELLSRRIHISWCMSTRVLLSCRIHISDSLHLRLLLSCWIVVTHCVSCWKHVFVWQTELTESLSSRNIFQQRIYDLLDLPSWNSVSSEFAFSYSLPSWNILPQHWNSDAYSVSEWTLLPRWIHATHKLHVWHLQWTQCTIAK